MNKPTKGEEVIVHGIMDDYGTMEYVSGKAYLVRFPNSNEGFWIPSSQCDFQITDRGWEATAPDWFVDKAEMFDVTKK